MSNLEIFQGVTSLTTIPKQQLEKITSRLPEYYRARAIIGHSTSQTSYSLQTMHMISDSPLSRMKQCLAQINKKYNALMEAYYKIERKKIEIKNLEEKTDANSRLTIQQNNSQIQTISVSMETTLRQIGMFQDMYDAIMKNNQIPKDWSEKDFEKQEISHMIKSSFRIAIQDLTATGRVSKAAVEYWEQIGILPQAGESLTRQYMESTEKLVAKALKDGKVPDVKLMYKFLDKMAETFKGGYKLALARMGLNELGSEEFMAAGQTKSQ